MWLSILAVCFSVLALLCSVWLYFQSLDKLSKGDLEPKLQSYWQEQNKKFASSVKEIETEWDNMYEKFAKLAGRMDRKKYLDSKPEEKLEAEPQRIQSRSDLLRGRKI